MSEFADLSLQAGYRPWMPHADVTDLDPWHVYETPLTGTFRLGETTVLFTQAFESFERLAVWAYVAVPHEQTDLQFPSVNEMRLHVDETFKNKEAIFALTRDDQIVQWDRQGIDSDLVKAAAIFFRDLPRHK